MELHPGVRYLHIGCDEVFQMGECSRCRVVQRDKLFLSHVASVASFVRRKYTHAATNQPVIPIIWHDMLLHFSSQTMEEFRIGELVEPMVRTLTHYRLAMPFGKGSCHKRQNHKRRSVTTK